MDFLTLFLVGRILRRPQRLAALLLAAGIGAIYGVASVFLDGNPIFGIFINIAVSVLMCYISFGRPLAAATALFYASGLLLGGGMTVTYLLINRVRFGTAEEITAVRVLSGGMPLGWMAVTAAVCGAATVISGRLAGRRAGLRSVKVTAQSQGREIKIDALVDSGSMLREPISGLPVMIVNLELLLPLLPPGLHDTFSAGAGALETTDSEVIRGVRLVIADGIAGKNLMLAYIPESVRINGRDAKLCIAADNTMKTEPETAYGGFGGIIPLCAVPEKGLRIIPRRGKTDTADIAGGL